MNFELAFNIVLGIATTIFGFWVKLLTAKIDDTADKVHRVMIEYQTREEARADDKEINRTLERLESKIDRLTEKLERKADRE